MESYLHSYDYISPADAAMPSVLPDIAWYLAVILSFWMTPPDATYNDKLQSWT